MGLDYLCRGRFINDLVAFSPPLLISILFVEYDGSPAVMHCCVLQCLRKLLFFTFCRWWPHASMDSVLDRGPSVVRK